MGQQHRNAFGHVHAGTAADAQHHIRLEIGAFGDAAGNAFHRQVGLGAVIDLGLDAIGLDIGDDGLELGVIAQSRIGADQGALSDLRRDHADGGALAGTEDHRGGQAQGAEDAGHVIFPFSESAASLCKSSHSPSSR